MTSVWKVTATIFVLSVGCALCLSAALAGDQFTEIAANSFDGSRGVARLPGFYTPLAGSPERVAIMDAIRLATSWTIKLEVDHLIVLRLGSRGVAIADVSDASGQSDNSGIFELEGLNRQGGHCTRLEAAVVLTIAPQSGQF